MRVFFPTLALVRRELLTHLRRVRSFVCLLLVVGFVTLLIVAAWPRNATPATMASNSADLLAIVALTLLGACALFIPGLTAASITVEKDRETFDLLDMTLIRRSGIVVAKATNAIGFFLLLAIAILPVLGTVFFMIGVDWVQLLQSFMIIVTTAIACAMAGMVCSALFRRTVVALVASYLSMSLVMGAWILPILLLAGISRWNAVARAFMRIAENVTPLGVLIQAIGGSLSSGAMAVFLAAYLMLIVVLFRVAVRLISRPQAPAKVEQRKPIDDIALLEARRKKFPYYLIDPLRRKKTIEDGRNPMLVRELRWGLLSRGTILIRIFYLSFAPLLLLGAGVFATVSPGSKDIQEATGFWLAFQASLVALFAPGLMANTMAKEYEQGNIDLLRTTLLRPADIVYGKLLAGAVSITPLVLGLLLSNVAAVVCIVMDKRGGWPALLLGAGTVLLSALLSLSLGFLASVFTRRTTTALLLSYLLNIIFFVGITVCVFLCFAVINTYTPFNVSDRWSSLAAFFSPIFAYVFDVADPFRDRLFPRYTLWASNFVIYLVFSVAVIRLSAFCFARLRMRER